MEDSVLFTKKTISTISIPLIFLLFNCIKSGISFPRHLSQPLTVGETVTFDLFSAPVTENENEHNLFPHTEINVTLKAVKILYTPVTKYIFYNPKIDLDCKCKCSEDHILPCRTQDLIKYDNCQFLQNKTTTCYNYENFGYGVSFCRNYFQVCCQVFFTANMSQKFYAIKLEKQSTKFELEVSSKDSQGIEQKTTYVGPKTMKRILVNGILISWNTAITEVDIPKNTWFFRKDSDVSTLRHTSTINEKYEANLRKMGWFQTNNDDVLLSIPQSILDSKFKVHVNKCNEKSSTYTWNLDAIQLNYDETESTASTTDPFREIKITNNEVIWDQPKGKIDLRIGYPKDQDNVFQSFLQVNKNVEESILYFVINSNDVYNVSMILNGTTAYNETFNCSGIETTKTFCHKRVLGQINDVDLWVCFQNVNETSDPLCRKPQDIHVSSNLCALMVLTTVSNRYDEEKSSFNPTSEIPITENNYPNISLLLGSFIPIMVILFAAIIFLIWKLRKNKKDDNQKHGNVKYSNLQPTLDESANDHQASDSGPVSTISTNSNMATGNLEDFIINFMNKQKENIKNIWTEIRPVVSDLKTFIDKWYVDLNLVEINKTKMIELPVNLQEFFLVKNSEEKPKRIIIEGGQGYGKTTLLLKLVHDWTNAGSHINNQFRMIFFLNLKGNITNSSIENLLKIQFKKLELDEEMGMKCVKAHLNNILILFDGYDQINDASKTHFHELLKDDEYENATMVITRRQEMSQVKEKTAHSSSLAAKSIDFFQKTILINGLSNENRVKVFKNFSGCDFKEIFPNGSNFVGDELFENPLFLILLSDLAKNINELKYIIYYEYFLNFIGKRYLISIDKVDKKQQVDLFDSGHSNYQEKCANQMKNFGCLAMQNLMENRPGFTKEEIQSCWENDEIFVKLGLLVNPTEINKNANQRKTFRHFHKSLMEIFTAYYVFRLGFQQENETDQKEFKKCLSILEKKIQMTSTNYLYHCLLSFLKSKSYLVIENLKKK